MTTYPTFNIPYKDAYTSEIEFKTQINEMQKGQEQRYPVWTYPKRTFTLKFDKSFEGRQELENFYINVMSNYGGRFYFEWEESKGGNGETYLCWIDSDSFEQNIKDYGFTDAQLKLVCIDDTEIEEVESLNFYHKAEANYNIAFNTIRDKILTSTYKLRNLWQAPRRSWTITFQKNDETRKQIEAFFIAKRGKFRVFQWKWDKKYGGDDQTYNVRFDDDTLQMDIEEYGFSEFQIKLKEVIPTNPLSEYDKDEIIPRKLLKIELEGGDINILDNETLDALLYDGVEYVGAPLEHGNITKDDNSAVNKLEIKLSNIGLGISSIIGNRGDVISNAPATLTMVLLNVNTNEIISGAVAVIFAGRCNNLTLDNEYAKMDIETPIGGFEYNCPVIKYRTSCQVRRFKDVRCGYNGLETSCDRTLTRCKALGNQANFRGFPSIPAETVIKV